MFKDIMAEVAALRRGRYLRNHTTINSWRRGYITNNLLIWPDAWARMMSRRMMSSFSSSSFVAPPTAITVTEGRCRGADKGRFGGRDGGRDSEGPRTLWRPRHDGLRRWLLLLVIINIHQCHSTINKILLQQ